jgi:hypothetical protein
MTSSKTPQKHFPKPDLKTSKALTPKGLGVGCAASGKQQQTIPFNE